MELRIELGNGTVPSIVWTYQLFKVGGADTNYTLTIGQGTGVGGTYDAMAYHNGARFSTRDRRHDNSSDNCAKVYGGAWWFNSCHYANLNSKYVLHTPESDGVVTPGANRLSWFDGSDHQHYTNTVFTLTWHGAAQHDTIQHGPRLHTIIIRGVGWEFEQNGGGKNPLAAVSILSAGRDSSSRKARAV